MKHILCVRLLNFPIDRWKRGEGRKWIARGREEVNRRWTQIHADGNKTSYLRSSASICGFKSVLSQNLSASRKFSPQMWVKGPSRPPAVKNQMDRVVPPSQTKKGVRSEPSIVLIRTIATQQIVVAINEIAKSSHIRVGMTLSQARAIDADLIYQEHDPVRDEKAMEALARWLMRFSPIVSFLPLPPGEGRGEGSGGAKRLSKSKSFSRSTFPHPNPLPKGEGIFLDITGCERVFKGLPRLVRHLHISLSRLRISCGIAVAPTPGAAWALTYSRKYQDQIVSSEQLKEALNDLPPMTLRLNLEMVQMLHHLGLSTIAQLEALPRESLPARFGSLLLTRLDQAFGRVPEPLQPIEPFSPIEAEREFDGAVAAIEPLWITLQELIDQIMCELLKRGRGARTVEAEFLHESAPLHRTVRLSRASRDGKNLFNLLRCALDDLPNEMKKKGRKHEGTEREYVDREGFLGVRLLVSASEPLSDEQITLLGQEEFEGQIELDRLIERVTVRMGEDSIVQPVLRESYLPEQAFAYVRAGSKASNEVAVYVSSRPLVLVPPREVRVMVSPSHDRDGKPILFVDESKTHPIVHAIGPERIAGQWWQGHDKTRDYFEVEDEQGCRFWIFRVQENDRWFLQGEY